VSFLTAIVNGCGVGEGFSRAGNNILPEMNACDGLNVVI